MKRAGELAIPVFCRSVDSLGAAFKDAFGDLTLDERKKFYEEVKTGFQNPEYKIEVHMLQSMTQNFLLTEFKLLITARKPEI
jgi:hypothetical protein